MLTDPRKAHQVHDDLESCFWVLLYDALYDFNHNSPEFDFKLFDEVDPLVDPDGTLHAVGGKLKVSYLVGLSTATWKCVPFNSLIQDLRETFSDFNTALTGGERKKKQLEESYAFIDNIDNIIKMFDTALDTPGWVEDYGPTIPRRKMTAEQASKQRDMVQALVIARNASPNKGATGVKLKPSHHRILKPIFPFLTGTKSGQVVQVSGAKRPLELDVLKPPASLPKRSRIAEAGPSYIGLMLPPPDPTLTLAIPAEPIAGGTPVEDTTPATRPRQPRARKGAKAGPSARAVEHRYGTRSKVKAKQEQVEEQKSADNTASMATAAEGPTRRKPTEPKTQSVDTKPKTSGGERKKTGRTKTKGPSEKVKRSPRPRRTRQPRR